ncbi:GIY-YIG nuclease family protein [Cytobacillus massiliigabonensis]|uniref:GIY-YIG nuclease family protein n=1 Tax=Cytobacillus massiliigabonensis TaxID=1871011 RepID=UPI000C84482E|nr:GIY-YIG nuclease family protein [Cytobacillus massiliigabonensis]
MDIHGYDFDFICEIKPECDLIGRVKEFTPQNEYINLQNLLLNKYGEGPFCSFTIPSEFRNKGVYAIKVSNEVVYIGECENFSQRFNAGYGQISPRNCFVGGQSTNCRINNNILMASKSNQEIMLYFHETDNRFEVEMKLINDVIPKWNISRGKMKKQRKHNQKFINETRSNISNTNSTCRDELLTAVEFIVKIKGKNEFSVKEVVDYMMELETNYKESTIRTHITSKCCVNAPSNHTTVYNDFRRISKGIYELYNLSK